MNQVAEPSAKRRFPPTFWLVIVFEFFERGSYYGMMSILSVYLTDVLLFRKESVGLIKSTIQPLLYFLPILSGALADRFGYRRMLTFAFTLLGLGYLLTSQMTTYSTVFLSLAVMGLGAGTFKPIISGTIARTTDPSNSTFGFGIYYWSINLGAFLFPLILVPWLKQNLGWHWVMLAAAMGTGSMVLPTLLFFREPAGGKPKAAREEEPLGRTLVRTVAGAFEIVYSPLVLLFHRVRGRRGPTLLLGASLALLLALGAWDYSRPRSVTVRLDHLLASGGDPLLLIRPERDQSRPAPYAVRQRHLLEAGGRRLILEASTGGAPEDPPFRASAPQGTDVRLLLLRPAEAGADAAALLGELARLGVEGLAAADLADALERLAAGRGNLVEVTVFKPNLYPRFREELLDELRRHPGLARLEGAELDGYLERSAERPEITLSRERGSPGEPPITVRQPGEGPCEVILRRDPATDPELRRRLLAQVRETPALALFPAETLEEMLAEAHRRPFFLPFVALLLATAAGVLAVERRFKEGSGGRKVLYLGAVLLLMLLAFWCLPGLTLFARILSTVIFSTVLSLFVIEPDDRARFADHCRFLLMIFLYSGFWVLYFQMFDSVLWYVKAYVDASPLDRAVGALLGSLGIGLDWRFDVEHVTVINAGTIILLQLVVSSLVKRTPALPTMITGIALGTLGMAVLAISPGIWVFLAGIVIFSIGEMTAHPKFISYIGQTAPRDRVAMYMGYIFLYGVIGSSIGGVLGASLYVRFVDELGRPRTLWLIFSLIGLATIAGLYLFHRWSARPRTEAVTGEGRG